MKKNLNDLRAEIDLLDKKLLKILSERIEIAKKIGILKKSEGRKLIDNERKAKVLNRWIESLKKPGISKKDTEKLYNLIHDLSVSIERKSD